MTVKINRQFASRSCRHIVNISALMLTMISLSLLSPTATADVYRWIGADGTVNYGERAPRNVEYTVVSRSASSEGKTQGNNRQQQSRRGRQAAQAAALPAPQLTPQITPQLAAGEDNLSDHQREMLERLQAAEKMRKDEIAKIRKSNCATSKRVLSSMQNNGRIRVRDDNGEEAALSDSDRSERIRQAQQSISVNCDSLS